MKRLITLVLIPPLLGGCLAFGGKIETTPVGRFQLVHNPHRRDMRDQVMLIDTVTGDTWFYHEQKQTFWRNARMEVVNGEAMASPSPE